MLPSAERYKKLPKMQKTRKFDSAVSLFAPLLPEYNIKSVRTKGVFFVQDPIFVSMVTLRDPL